jgi:MFS transporter, SP family, general alpha glucoside:H+ symporter
MINPDAGNLGGKVGYVFAGGGVIFTSLLFLYLPETKGLTTDEVPTLRSA